MKVANPQQHECRILQCWMKQFAVKCLISQQLDVPKYQIVWNTSQASRDATFNSLEQFQLVESKFKLFAPHCNIFKGMIP